MKIQARLVTSSFICPWPAVTGTENSKLPEGVKGGGEPTVYQVVMPHLASCRTWNNKIHSCVIKHLLVLSYYQYSVIGMLVRRKLRHLAPPPRPFFPLPVPGLAHSCLLSTFCRMNYRQPFARGRSQEPIWWPACVRRPVRVKDWRWGEQEEGCGWKSSCWVCGGGVGWGRGPALNKGPQLGLHNDISGGRAPSSAIQMGKLRWSYFSLRERRGFPSVIQVPSSSSPRHCGPRVSSSEFRMRHKE